VIIASVKLNFPAVHYDEALYVNAALGGIDQTTFMTKSFGPIPILLMPYIGALKSYLYYPIFGFFGVSPITMRLPMIFVTASALYLLHLFLRRRLGDLLAICVLLITAFNASFVIFTRLDFGPVVLDFLLKIVALYLLVQFVQKQTIKPLLLFWAVIFLGVFNKLNFIWYMNAFVVAFVMVWGKTVWHKLGGRDKKRFIAISALGFLICSGYSLLISKTYTIGSTFGFVGVQSALSNLKSLVAGNWFYEYAFSSAPLGAWWALYFVVSIIGGGALLLWRDKSKTERSLMIKSLFAFSGYTSLILLAQLVVTRQATAGWHYFSLYPFLSILFVLSLYVILRNVLKNQQQIGRALLVVLVILIGLYQLNIYRSYIAVLDKPTVNNSWSPALYGLLDFTRSHKNAQFISLDWGIHVQLIALDPIPNKYFELMGPLVIEDPTINQRLYQTYIHDKPNAYYITHTGDKQSFPVTKTQFLKLAQQHGYKVSETVHISDGQTSVFDIYKLSK
jgi:hypothetical protein